jgi:LysM repeat protein
MIRKVFAGLVFVLLMGVSFVVGGLMLPRLQNAFMPQQTMLTPQTGSTQIAQQPDTTDEATLNPTENFPPNTPLASITAPPPINTLRPPPTFEPPTDIPLPTATSMPTATNVRVQDVVIEGLQGVETPTPTSTEGCEPREDWTLIYEVKANDALATIAQTYGTWADELVEANCLTDPDMIVIGQKLHVPGETHPATPQYNCTWQLLAPIDYAFNIDGNGTLTFNWIGPRSPRNLIRVYRPNDTNTIIWEQTIDLRQNHTINLATTIPGGGEFIWYVYPLDLNFQQIDCLEGGPWHFHKSAATLTSTEEPSFL